MSQMYANAEKHKKRFSTQLNDFGIMELKLMIRVLKDARRYCRSNTALHNYLNTIFSDTGICFKESQVIGRDGKLFKITDIIVNGYSIYNENESELD